MLLCVAQEHVCSLRRFRIEDAFPFESRRYALLRQGFVGQAHTPIRRNVDTLLHFYLLTSYFSLAGLSHKPNAGVLNLLIGQKPHEGFVVEVNDINTVPEWVPERTPKS